jgi:hypothetical protein
MHAWSDHGQLDSASIPRQQLPSGRAWRATLLVAASRALHEHDGVDEQGEAGWVRRHVAQALELSGAAVEADFAGNLSSLMSIVARADRVHLRRRRTLAATVLSLLQGRPHGRLPHA